MPKAFERPPVNAPIHEFLSIVLPGWCNDLQAGAEKALLLPLGESLCRHCRSVSQVDRQPGGEIQQPRSINGLVFLGYLALKRSDTVWQRCRNVGGPP